MQICGTQLGHKGFEILVDVLIQERQTPAGRSLLTKRLE